MGANMKQRLIAAQMGCDERIPREAIGYIGHIQADNISATVLEDSLAQLEKYAPDLVEEYRDAELGIGTRYMLSPELQSVIDAYKKAHDCTQLMGGDLLRLICRENHTFLAAVVQYFAECEKRIEEAAA
jgi:hypothetical protein